MAEVEKTRQTPPFGGVRVDREVFMAAATRVRDMVLAAAEAAFSPGVDQVEHQRHVSAYRRMQGRGWIPGLVAHAADELADIAGGLQGYRSAVAGEHVARVDQAAGLDLQAFERRVDIACGTVGRIFLTQHVPRLQRTAQLHFHTGGGERTIAREAEFQVRFEPVGREVEAILVHFGDHVGEVLPDEMRQHEAIMQFGAPAHQPRRAERPAPEARDQGAQQQLLGERHARMRRHFEGAQFKQTQAPGRRIG